MRVPFIVAGLMVAGLAQAQTAPIRATTVTGVVRDSSTGAPLSGALVQLAPDTANAVPRTVVADSAGHYGFDHVGRGRYLIGFFHPMLDSLTLEPILKELIVAGNVPVEFDLGIPSGGRLRPLFCGSQARTGGAFVGVVREASDGQPVSGASVVAEWVDLVIGRGGVSQHASRLATTTKENGWFALCGVPAPGVLNVSARHGADTTDLIDVTMSNGGFARRDLYVAPARTGGRLSGRVVTERGTAVSGAIIGLPRVGQTRSDSSGAWTLTGLPPGTRMLEVRAIGYYPVRRPVDVVPDALPVRVAMATFESVLDTVQIRASGIGSEGLSGFGQRRRSSGMGRFLSEADIQRRNPTETSDLFRSVSGVYVGDSIMMRGAFASAQQGSNGECNPNVFLDGMRMPTVSGLTATELDSWVNPARIAAIEIYPDAPPPQFQVALSGCGSIVIWTKRMTTPPRKPPA
jgi:hypothetical protein